MSTEIERIITDQINRHVAMSEEHRAWLAKDICERVNRAISDDTRRLDWLCESASGVDWQLNQCKLITRAGLDICMEEAEAEESVDTKGEP